MHRRDVLMSVVSATAGANLVGADTEALGAEAGKAKGTTGGRLSGAFLETGDGTSLFTRAWGTGKPVVFVTSWAVNSDMWEYQMLDLASQGLRCVTYDRRGHGRSSQPDHGYDFDTLADDLATVIERFDLREVTLVGHSMGGGEITRYLSRHGAARIARVAFLGSTTPFVLKTADNPEGIDESFFEAQRSALSKDRPRWLADNAPPFFGLGLPQCSVAPETIQWLIGLCLQPSLKALLDIHRVVTSTDFRSELSAIKVPALVIHGDNDKSAPLEITGRKTARLIPGSQLKIYEGAAHGFFITHRERLSRDLLAFIRE